MVQPAWKRVLPLILVTVFLVALPSVVMACPNCKDAMAQNDPHHSGMVRGYFISILFMMSMPFLILSGLVTYFYLLVRKARSQQAASVLQAAEYAAQNV